MPRHYRKYTDEQFVQYAKEVKSLSSLLKKLNLRPAGGNFANVKRLLQKLKVDTSHWTGQAWNRGQQLKDWSEYTRIAPLKKHLVNKRGIQCESCRLTKWLNSDIPLEVHHKDGDRTNNNENNLQLLCCNCHSFTDSWRNKSNKTATVV